MDKVLVTGAGGLIGHEVCKFFQGEKRPFAAIYRNRPATPVPWDYIVCDLEHVDQVQQLPLLGIGGLVHAAAAIPGAQTDAEACYKINKTIDQNICKIFSAASPELKVIFLSTTNFYLRSAGAIDEESPIEVGNPYAASKLAGEQLFSSIFSNSIMLRINAPYAPHQRHETVLKIFIDRALADLDLYFSGTGNREQDFTHAHDIARAIACALSADQTGSFNISGGAPISMKDLGALVIKTIPGCRSQVVSSGAADPQEGVKAKFNIDKAFSNLHWSPKIPIATGIADWIKLTAS